MKLAFDQYGDISSRLDGSIETVSDATAELGRFLVYAGVPLNSYISAPYFGNSLNNIIGRVQDPSIIPQIKEAIDWSLTSSEMFFGNNFFVNVSFSDKDSLIVTIVGSGVNATWEVIQNGKGVKLVSFAGQDEPIAEGVQKASEILIADGGTNLYNITHIFNKAKELNGLSDIVESTFSYRIYEKLANSSVTRLFKTFEYSIIHSLFKYEIRFELPPLEDTTITIEVWPNGIASYEETSNKYLSRKT